MGSGAEVVAMLKQADEVLAEGTPIGEVARFLGVSGVTPPATSAAAAGSSSS